MVRKITLIIHFVVSAYLINAQTPLTVAENFNIKTPTGETVNLFNILDGGQYALIDFFNITCGPCQTYAPDVQMSHIHFGSNQQEIFYMGISYSGNNQMIIEWDQTYGITFPTISGTEGGGYGVHINYGIQTVPTIVLIAPNRDIIGQLHIPAYTPDVTAIDSMLIANGLNPVLTGGFSTLEKDYPDFRVFPNPVANHLNVSANLNPANDIKIEIYSLTGTKLLSQKISVINNEEQSIDLRDFNNGLYLVAITENGQIIDRRKINVIR